MVTDFTQISTWISTHPFLFALGLIWMYAWKGIALWKSAERKQKSWFVFLLIMNTFGILEIFYIFVVSKKHEVKVINN